MTAIDLPAKTPRAPLAAIGKRVRRTWTTWRRQVPAVVGAARHRLRRPALTIGGLGCIAAAFYQIDLFAGLLATGLVALVYEWVGGEDE